MTYEFKNMRVLVVDDDKTMKLILVNVLKTLKIKECLTAEDAKQGFDVFKKHKPDIVITDWSLGETNGVELVKKIRAINRKTEQMTPILLMSGHTESSIVKTARDVGVTEFLSKPFSLNDLANRVGYIFSNPRKSIKSPDYYGPDRRRLTGQGYKGPFKRKGDKNDV